MRLCRLEAGFAAVLLLLGLWIVQQALAYGVFGPNITGAGFFPFLAGCLLAASAGRLLIGHVRRGRGLEGTLDGRQVLPVAGVVVAAVTFLLVVEIVGMVLLTPFYVATVSYFIERPRTRRGHVIVWATAIGFTVAAYVLFDYLLNVPLPRGPFER